MFQGKFTAFHLLGRRVPRRWRQKTKKRQQLSTKLHCVIQDDDDDDDNNNDNDNDPTTEGPKVF